jgi:alkylation response protein AidB-like acyl-CoA dehydrogenase
LSEEQLAVKEAARDFAQNVLKPGVIERDNLQKFPAEQIKQLAELGFMGMMVDPKYGGSGMDTLSYVLAMEEISKVDASTSVCMSVNNSLVCWGLEKFGTEEQKQKYLVPLAKGEKIGAFCLSEPEAGSDATSQRTTAVDMGDHYILNGTKNWITNGSSASIYLVIAQTNVEAGHKGINALIIERGMDGFIVGAKEDKMGIRGSDTHTLLFNDVKVPKENRIGEDGFGFKFAMKVLSGGRIGIAAQALGIAGGAYELALDYSKQRKAFGKEIYKHQAIAFKLADMATEIEAAKMLVYKSAWDKDNGRNYDQSSAMAKLYASKVAMEQTVEAVQIHGGYGFVKEYHVERLMRDAKITQIYEGTSEVQKIVISRGILG